MNIWLPNVDAEGSDMVYPYLAFCYKMKFQKREWTGYKELAALGLDANGLVSLGILYMPTPKGSYKFVEDNIMKLVKIYSIDDPEEYYSNDALGTYDYNDGFSSSTCGGGVLDTPPTNVDPIKGQVNQAVSYLLESKSDGYVLNSKYFDFDVSLFNCLSEKRQEYFLWRINQCRTFKTLDVNAQSVLDDYALREMKECIKKGAYKTLPDFFKDWFSDKIKQSKRMQKYYGYYMRP